MSNERDAAIDKSINDEREGRAFRDIVRVKRELAEERTKSASLQDELKLCEERLAIALGLDREIKPLPVLDRPKNVKHRGAFVLMCSDWHIGERVDKDQVGGRNEYNPTIAAKSVDALIEGARWFIEAWRSGPDGYGWQIDQAVVWLGGDIITGMIHADLAESNYLSPTEEVLLAQDLCVKVIDSIAMHEGIRRVYVPTSYGNHGRDTPDRRVSTGWKRSYEWLLYQILARRYANDEVVRVDAGRDEISRLKVLNTKLRFNHGDQFRFADGVGGLTIPARKWLAKLDGTEPADVTCIGHHHTAMDIGNLVVNNSLIGWGPYAQRVAPFSKPSQMCFLIDEKYGKRMSTEIIVR